METMCVKAELTFRDGKKEKIYIEIKNENNLSSIMEGIHKLSEKVSKLLSELVEQEKHSGASTQGELIDANCCLCLLICCENEVSGN